MAANARRDLVKALKATFGPSNADDTDARHRFDDYEPPEGLLTLIDAYLSSSDIVQNTSDRDWEKLRETLVEDCFEDGIVQQSPAAKSAFIVVLDKFSSSESHAVSEKDVRELWWGKLLKNALLLEEPHANDTEIPVGRRAEKAAKDMVTRALKPDSLAFQQLLLNLCLNNPPGSSYTKHIRTILSAYGKSNVKSFYTLLDAQLANASASTLHLLNLFLQNTLHTAAFAMIDCPLFAHILDLLEHVKYETQEKEDANSLARTSELVWISSALTTLNIVLPCAATVITSILDRLLLIFARVLLFTGEVERRKQALSEEAISAEKAVMGGNTSDAEQTQHDIGQSCVMVPSLLDYFTTLYVLCPSNTLAFLSKPLEWLQKYDSRRARLQKRGGSHSRGLEHTVSRGRAEPEAGGSHSESPSGAGRPRSRSRSHSKGRRSKVKKQHRDNSKHREHERRRSGLQSRADTASPSETESDNDASPNTSSIVGTSIEARLLADVPVAAPHMHGPDSSNIRASGLAHARDASSSDESEDENRNSRRPARLPDDLTRMDWRYFRRLCEPFLSQHTLLPGAIATPIEELFGADARFHTTVTSELIEEIVRYRLPLNIAAEPVGLLSPSSSHTVPMHASGMALSDINETEAIHLLQTKLLFECLQKEQLKDRLGANLRERVNAGSREAELQNLKHVVRSLKVKLASTEDDLAKVRQDAADSRERLNKYSDAQQVRLESLRKERRTWQSAEVLLKAERDKSSSTVADLTSKHAEAEKQIFDLQADDRYRQTEMEKQQEELISLRARVAELEGAQTRGAETRQIEDRAAIQPAVEESHGTETQSSDTTA